MMLAGVIAAVTFVIIAAALCVAAVLAMLGAAHVYLSGPEAIERDGLARGRRAPRWSLTDSAGTTHQSPPARPLQLVIFADHSLKSFPSVLDGLRELIARRDPDLEIVVLLRQRNALAEPLLRMLGLDGVPVLTGSPALYADYNVRVGPFAIFADAAGRVRASSCASSPTCRSARMRRPGVGRGPVASRAGRSTRRCHDMTTTMSVLAAAAKAGLAVLLLVAGGAKLAGLDGFAATVRLFLPAGLLRPAGPRPLTRLARWVALAVALGEVGLGAASLASPAASGLNLAVLIVGGAFVAVSLAGYMRHRGRSCRCFGALTRRRFDRAGVGRAVLIAAVAGVAMTGLPASAVRLSRADRGLLLAAALLLAAVAFTAASVLARNLRSGTVS